MTQKSNILDQTTKDIIDKGSLIDYLYILKC